MKTRGDSAWESFPSYLDLVVPRILRFLTERNLTITFFVVGQDATLDKNREALAGLSAAGHEIGNHSFHHEPWLHLYSKSQIDDDIHRAEDTIEGATGQRPRGFRGPGFSLSRATLDVLHLRGYHYDASTFPTFLGPLARLYYFMTAKLPAEERRKRNALFGPFREGFRPVRAYRWRLEAGTLLEIPVTTMPLLKAPFHVSYLLYLSAFSPALALAYFRLALALCRMTGTQPSLLLHPLDFLGGDEVPELAFFPAMRLPGERKTELTSEVLRIYSAHYTALPLQLHAAAIDRGTALPTIEPRFSQAHCTARTRHSP
jgi:hypothetical protein